MSDACGCGDGPTEQTRAQPGEEPAAARLWHVHEIRFAAVAAVLLAAAYTTGWAGGPEWGVLLGQAGALAVAGWTFVPVTLRRLARGRIGVGTLMTVAAVGAVLLGEVGEAAMLAVLYTIAEGLEEYSLTRTRSGLRSLLGLVPATATVRRDGQDHEVPPGDLRVGDLLVLRPGERLATDGRVVSGTTSLDTSAITGESVPVEVTGGDDVHAGSVNGTGVLEIEATRTAEDNSLARIVRVVEQEQSRKGSGQRLADRIARPLVPGVLVAAALVAVVGSLFGEPATWIERALVVLVAASPCALAISVPVTVVSAVGAATRRGALVKGGAALEALGRVRTVALDKTGTLTRNRPTVTEVVGGDRDRVLAVAAALEARSEHPLAPAILAAAGVPDRPAEDVQAVVGAGLTGSLDGRPVRLGRAGWIDPGPFAGDVERLRGTGATVVLVEEDGAPIGAVAVRDDPRPEAADVVSELRRRGHRVAVLTGDHPVTARAVADEVGVDEVHAGLRPEDKARVVADLRAHGTVLMVGDGVNDAPALAAADAGVAMGAMGTDVAIETADAALMGEDLRHLPALLDHARRSRVIMWQSVGLSLAIIVGLMPLALFGVLGLAAVVLVHELAEVVVVANGVRAGRVRERVPDRTGDPGALDRAAQHT